MRELKDITKEILNAFELEDIESIRDFLYKLVLLDNKDKYYDKYMEIVEDLEVDWILNIYSNMLAERKELKQDYTPQSLAQLVGEIAFLNNSKIQTCYDCCAGSGSLTLALYNKNPNLYFYLEELDDNVIPFLLFNLSLRNMNGEVINGNVLTGERYCVYKIKKGTKYSNIEKMELNGLYEIPKVDVCVSNPPFNLRIKQTIKTSIKEFKNGRADVVFALKCLELLKDNGRFILIDTAMITQQSSKNETWFREYVVNNNILDTYIQMPPKMFENTPIQVMVYYFDKNKKDNYFKNINLTKYGFSQTIRYRKGSKNMRTYNFEKIYNCLDETNINEIICAIENINHHLYSYGMYAKDIRLAGYKTRDEIIQKGYLLGLEKDTIDKHVLTLEEVGVLLLDRKRELKEETQRFNKVCDKILDILEQGKE